MANKTQKIRIESILGGQSPTTNFAASDQFRASLGIDPALPVVDLSTSIFGSTASGLLRPSGTLNWTGASFVGSAPMWIVSNPKLNKFYIYDTDGSTYSAAGSVITELSDGGSMSGSSGNGCAYYDNYIYFAKNTTVARYGPLDGTPGFDGNYWSGTLSKAALTDTTTYPQTGNQVSLKLRNHYMHRHSDGALYFADVVGNQGVIHKIKTTKTTVEGDTDYGSTFNVLDFGYGMYPIAIESYGDLLVIALYEGTTVGGGSGNFRGTAKLAFWDTTSDSPNSMIFVEFPDDIISAMKNVNGTLYIASGNKGGSGFRVSRYVGGNTVQEIAYSELGAPPFQGGMDGTSDRLLFGSDVSVPTQASCVFSLGLQKSGLSNGLFIPYRGSSSETDTTTTAICMGAGTNFLSYYPLACFSDGDSGSTGGLDSFGTGNYGTVPQIFWSQVYNLGQRFKITKIRIPLAQAIAANMTVVPKVYTDDGAGTTHTLTTINNTNYPNSERNIVIRPEGCTGQHNFWLELTWSGSALCVVGLPITIEYELLDD